MRTLVFGNSGSGKSTWARVPAERHGLPHLDLDTLVWEPGQVAVPRPQEAVTADLQAFLNEHDRWVIEGCYGALVAAAAPHASLLVFLDPGREVCLANNRRRPWEPHKYASPEAQDAMLDALQAWVATTTNGMTNCPGSLSGFGGRGENSAVRGQISDDSPAHSGSMGQETAGIWTAQPDSQPGQSKPDRLLASPPRPVRSAFRPQAALDRPPSPAAGLNAGL